MCMLCSHKNNFFFYIQDLAKLALVKHLGLAGLHELIYPREYETNVDAKYSVSVAEKIRHQLTSFHIPQVNFINCYPLSISNGYISFEQMRKKHLEYFSFICRY